MPLETDGYQILPGLVAPDICDLFTAYALFSELQNPHRIVYDNQVRNTYALYGDPLTEALLLYCHGPLQKQSGLDLLPTYTYYRVYRPGAELPPHQDRPECEVSVSLCLGYDYESADITYPLFIENNALVLQPGDAILYLGTERIHSRPAFVAPRNAYHVQAFLHYVRADGPYSSEVYDSRIFAGYPRNKAVPHPYHATIGALQERLAR
jgi:hypothetical protein